MATVLKNLTVKPSEHKKIWFIEIDKMFQEKNLKIFHLPLESLEKIIIKKEFGKFPDPIQYFAGFTYNPIYNDIKKTNAETSVPKKNINLFIKPATKYFNQ